MGSFMTAIAASTLVAASALPVNATEKTLTWTPEVMMKTKQIADVQIAPDALSALYVVTEQKIGEEKGTPLSRIYKTNLGSPGRSIPFSALDVSSMQPRWSPDGEWIAFISNREGKKNLYLIHSEGGEAIALTKGNNDIQTFSWSPDGKKIAFVKVDDIEAEEKVKQTNRSYVYGQDELMNRLWLMDVFSPEPAASICLTSNDYCVRGSGDFGTTNTEFDWSPDSKTIVFAYSPAPGFDSFHLDSSLALIDIETKCITALEKHAFFEAMPRYSPDGQSIAYVSGNSPQRYSFDRQLAIRSLDGQKHHLLSQTYNEGAFLAGPNFLGWSQEGRHLLFFEPKGTKYHIALVPVDGGRVEVLDTGDIFFKEPALSHDRSMLGFVGQTPTTPPEAFITTLNDFAPIQMSQVNSSFKSYPEIKTERVVWNSVDGMRIEGLLSYPVNYKEGEQYPLLLVIHGGPMGFFEEAFVGTPYPYPLAAFSQEGFLVLRPNPRGSSGYGKSFRCANYQDWGGRDFQDLMAGVDHLIDQGSVDPESLGVMGWSYGGYMTAWTISQTNRFKAASMGAGISNTVSQNGTTDLYRFMVDYLGDFPVNRKLYEERSPLNYVANVKTPCLIQHGTEDKRVPVSQAFEYYHALKRLDKEALLVLYPGMEHRLSDPNMQLDAMKRNLEWFLHHLGNR